MKKLTLIVAFLMIFTRCTNDSYEDQSDLLIGSWAITEIMEDSSLSQSLQYTFNADKTFVSSRVIIDNTTNEIIGYRYRALGTYDISRDILGLRKSEIYLHDDLSGLFSDINALELANYSDETTINFLIDDSQNLLTFIYPPCGPAESCLGNQIFQRIE